MGARTVALAYFPDIDRGPQIECGHEGGLCDAVQCRKIARIVSFL